MLALGLVLLCGSALAACGGPPEATATPVPPATSTPPGDTPTAPASLSPTLPPAPGATETAPASPTPPAAPTLPPPSATPLPPTAAPATPTPPLVVVIVPTATHPQSRPTLTQAPAVSSRTPTATTGDALASPTALPVDTPVVVVSTPLPVAAPTRPATAGSPVGRSAVPLVVIDPGHGGSETGAESAGGLIEKNVNLRIALAVAPRLRADGVQVILTRSGDTGVDVPPRDVNGNGVVDVDDDLQARVDLANASGAWALVSIHNNAQPGDPRAEGTTTYYCDLGAQPVQSLALAESLQTHVLQAIRAAGYPTTDRHVRDDAELRKPGGHLYLLGPHNARIARPSTMPGALVETLFLSNAADAAQLDNPAMIDAIAGGFASGIEAYLATVPR